MSYLTDYRPFIKLGFRGIASFAAITYLKSVADVVSYLKKRDYQPGQPLTWEELKDNVHVDPIMAATLSAIGFKWTPAYESSSPEESPDKEDSKEDLKTDKFEGPLEYTGTLEQLQKCYVAVKPLEESFEKDPDIWSKSTRTLLTDCLTEGYSLLNQERLNQNQLREYQRLQGYEKERLSRERTFHENEAREQARFFERYGDISRNNRRSPY